MGPFGVVAADEVVELGLLLKEVLRGRSGGLDLQGQMHALVAAVLLRMAGLDALDLDAEPQRPTESLERLNKALGLAKGTPLSVRMAVGKPKSLKALSNTQKA